MASCTCKATTSWTLALTATSVDPPHPFFLFFVVCSVFSSTTISIPLSQLAFSCLLSSLLCRAACCSLLLSCVIFHLSCSSSIRLWCFPPLDHFAESDRVCGLLGSSFHSRSRGRR